MKARLPKATYKALKKTIEERVISYLFISHDLKLVSTFCDRIGVMHHGKLVEIGYSYDVINNSKNEFNLNYT